MPTGGDRGAILSGWNENDLDEIPDSARKVLEFTFATDVREVIEKALDAPSAGAAMEER